MFDLKFSAFILDVSIGRLFLTAAVIRTPRIKANADNNSAFETGAFSISGLE